jgi:DNA polymerase III delta prime subunit
MENTALLSETLRPQTLADLILPEGTLASLTRMVQSGQIMNMLFYGSPGIGKTSAARILLRELNSDIYEINGSFNNGDKTMVGNIERFASTVSILGGPKICFIDEADAMSTQVQASLRNIIERVSGNARFLLTANDEKKLTPAMKSRCLPISFDVPPSQIRNVVDRMAIRYEQRLKELGYRVDERRVREIVAYYFPDLRMIANMFQMEFIQS